MLEGAEMRAPIQDRPEPPTAPQDTHPRTNDEVVEAPQRSFTEIGAAWVEIEGTAEKAREELKGVLSSRTKATEIRSRAQQVLDEAKAIQEEAERGMAHARNTLNKAVALNPETLRSMVTNVRTLEEAIRTERHLRQGTCQQAEEEEEEEADWARQRATDAILNALSSVRKASNSVSRELEEAKRTAATAESLRQTSQDDLKRARGIMSEVESLMEQEARSLLNQPGTGQTAPPRERLFPHLYLGYTRGHTYLQRRTPCLNHSLEGTPVLRVKTSQRSHPSITWMHPWMNSGGPLRRQMLRLQGRIQLPVQVPKMWAHRNRECPVSKDNRLWIKTSLRSRPSVPWRQPWMGFGGLLKSRIQRLQGRRQRLGQVPKMWSHRYRICPVYRDNRLRVKTSQICRPSITWRRSWMSSASLRRRRQRQRLPVKRRRPAHRLRGSWTQPGCVGFTGTEVDPENWTGS